jgi:hypothetical protein
MKRLFLQPFFFSLLIVFTASCQSNKELVLRPASEQQVYAVRIEDATEVDLLRQQLKLDIIRAEGNTIFFHSAGDAQLRQLESMGYGRAEPRNAEDVYELFGRIPGKYNEQEIISNGVSVVNREKDHVIVYGPISRLKALKARGYKLLVPGDFRPREIRTTVNTQADVQWVYNLGVDIFTAEKDSLGKGGFIIRGGAYDRQIDSIRKRNFPVTIVRPHI